MKSQEILRVSLTTVLIATSLNHAVVHGNSTEVSTISNSTVNNTSTSTSTVSEETTTVIENTSALSDNSTTSGEYSVTTLSETTISSSAPYIGFFERLLANEFTIYILAFAGFFALLSIIFAAVIVCKDNKIRRLSKRIREVEAKPMASHDDLSLGNLMAMSHEPEESREQQGTTTFSEQNKTIVNETEPQYAKLNRNKEDNDSPKEKLLSPATSRSAGAYEEVSLVSMTVPDSTEDQRRENETTSKSSRDDVSSDEDSDSEKSSDSEDGLPPPPPPPAFATSAYDEVAGDFENKESKDPEEEYAKLDILHGKSSVLAEDSLYDQMVRD